MQLPAQIRGGGSHVGEALLYLEKGAEVVMCLLSRGETRRLSS